MDLFETIDFGDQETAAKCCDVLRDLCGEGFMAPLAVILGDIAEPCRGIVGLTRFLENSLSARTEADLMLASPRYLRMLLTLFSQSTMMCDVLCRNPEYGSWLWSEAALDRNRCADEVQEELRQAFARYPDFEARRRWMRRYSRRELLRIAAREVFAYAPFNAVVADISCLADVMIEGARIAAHDHLSSRFGALVDEEHPDSEVTFVILAMGKLGGYELNFSSDIDLLFIYSADGHTRADAPEQATTDEYYRKLSELIIKALSEQTAEGRVFRVDMRLRPFGNSGPLACSLSSAVEYYSNYGRAWERQALIKARPCAGDMPLGETFRDMLRPFIYPRYFDDATLEDIRGIKQQTEAAIAHKAQTNREVKLGRGGIRDIEFTVQMLQLLHGGRWPDSRTTNTIEAIRALGHRQRLSPFETETLERNYIFLRQVEHRLQIEGGQQTHVLPEKQEALDGLARRLGYEDGAAFMNLYRERTAETRRILEQFLAAKGDGNLWVIELLDSGSTAGAGLDRLRTFGFQDPERARQEMLLLANGPEESPYTRDTAQRFAAITPFLLEALARTPDPDGVLLRFSRILTQLPVAATLYSLLQYNARLTHYLATILSNSEYFSELLVRDISLLDLIGTPGYLENASRRESLEAELDALEQAANPAAAPYRLRNGETLKVALRELILGVSVAVVGDELTQLAEVIARAALRQARETITGKYGPGRGSFAVLALGKFGGCELGYGSDLDLVFVYEEPPIESDFPAISSTEYYAALASDMLKRLKEPTRHGILYDVDARLRPDGSKGALAIPASRFRQYYLEEAHFWERFALMKVRAVAGDPAFMARVEAEGRDIAFSGVPSREALESLESLRKQLAGGATEYDLKRREGGIAEIEFTTRLLQLQHVRILPELKRGGAFTALAILREKALISNEAYVQLRDAYAFFRQLLNRVRMMRGNSTAQIPEGADSLKRLAACLGLQDDIMDQIQYHAEHVHRIYRHIYTSVYNRAS